MTANEVLGSAINEADGVSILGARFRIHPVKCGAGVAVSPGPEATEEDRLIAAAPGVFDSLEDAADWLAEQL